MEVRLYSVITPNGLIAGKGDDLSFITDTEWQGVMKEAYDIGNCIMGRRAYEVLLKKGKFPFNCLNIVLTKSPKRFKNKWPGKVIFTNKSPRAILNMLSSKGCQKALLIGGGHVNASFAKQKLIDEIVLDIEPKILTSGIKLFEGKEFGAMLRLIDARRVSPDEARIVYKVEK